MQLNPIRQPWILKTFGSRSSDLTDPLVFIISLELRGDMNLNKLKMALAIIIPLVVFFLPLELIPLPGLTPVGQRMLAIFILACLFWVLEPIPAFATSMMIVLLELVFISNKSFIGLRNSLSPDQLGDLIPYKQIMGVFASPIIMLFLGGFSLAIAASKYRLDMNLARVLVKPFGKNPKYVLLGLMLITAVFSMFMSNTATTAMMFAIVTPILALFDKGDTGKVAFALGIPFAANIGGIGTPIGTPPNALAMKYLQGDHLVSFGQWMGFAIPYVAVMIAFLWILLGRVFPFKTKEISLTIKGKFLKTRPAYIVYFTFAFTILGWLTDFLHGMNSYVIALFPVTIFVVSGIITPKDLKLISWDVLWLVAGGIALGLGLEKSGLTNVFVASLPFENISPLVLILLTTIIAIVMATLMSNTATANLLLPIIFSLGTAVSASTNINSSLLIIAVTLACSLAMSLPVSTPPNAIAYASGLIKGGNMAKVGVIIGAVGLIMNYVLIFILYKLQVV